MEYLLLIVEFLIVKGWKSLIKYFIIPIIIGLLIYYKADDCNYIANTASFHSNIVTVLGILIGFTISTFAVLLTVNNPNIDKAKDESLHKKVFSKDLSLYDSILIGLAYIIIIQGFLLIANFLYPIFFSIQTQEGKLLFSINISIIIHIILILMRNILDFYFMLTKKK